MNVSLLSQTDPRDYFELAPLLPVSQWWHTGLILFVFAAVVSFTCWLYRRDAASLPRPIALTMASMRLLAIIGLLIFFLGPEKRTETKVVNSSRLAIMVDTSLSMGLADREQNTAEPRFGQVVKLFQDTAFLENLNRNHEISVYRFADSNQPEQIVSSRKQQTTSASGSAEDSAYKSLRNESSSEQSLARKLALPAIVALALALLMLPSAAFQYMRKNNSRLGPWLVALGCWCMTLGLFAFGLADVLDSDRSMFDLFSNRTADEPVDPPEESDAEFNEAEAEGAAEAATQLTLDEVNWSEALKPQGISTRLGNSLHDLIAGNRDNAMAGIIVLTDGQSNEGIPTMRAIKAASDANIPVYVIGIGSNQPARNVRLSETRIPQRVLPGDKFNVTGILQGYGFENSSVRVQLSSSPEDQPDQLVIEDEKTVQVAADGQPVNVDFLVEQKIQGRRRYTLQLFPPAGDFDESDNTQSSVVQVLRKKTKVLLIAGGPSRDYQFLRNQLYRDDNIELDVWLQMARPGASQESDNLLFRFPDDPEDLFSYDCLVAFDPDWRELTTQQCGWLERWVSEKAGGLLVVAGPVFTPEWTRRPRGDAAIDLIRALYPVSFYSQGSATLKLGRFGGEQPFPLKFSREGRTARHLWLGEQPSESEKNWNEFAGVFGYYAVNEAKAGANVLAWFSDASTAVEDRLPIYLASQYYGAGRVFFQASGEIWRLRSNDVKYFQDYYSNLIRWVSEGRLLRDSNRGVLLLERDRCWVGDQLQVRAILKDATDRPLLQPKVTVNVRRPDGTVQAMELANLNDATRPGSFLGQFGTQQEGTYEFALPVPFSQQQRILRATVQASIPDLEKVKPERNDALMQELADRTGGRYFYEMDENSNVVWNDTNHTERPSEINTERKLTTSHQTSLVSEPGLTEMISPVDQELYLPGSPNVPFAKKLASWLLIWIVVCLCTEWIIRRLHKLA